VVLVGPYSWSLFCCLGYLELMLIEGHSVLCMVCVLVSLFEVTASLSDLE